jgi:hypothetical protein
MAKTRRTKRNGKAPIKSRNITLAVVKNGERKQAHKNATTTHVGLVLTGVNRGKLYPYRSVKRGGPDVRLTKRTVVGTVAGAAKSAVQRLAEIGR